MAYTHASKFVDVHSLDELQRRLSRVPAEAAKQVRKRNRQHAAELVKRIKAEMPVAGGMVKHRHSKSKAKGASRRGPGGSGQLKRSVRAKVGADYASVRGGVGLPRTGTPTDKNSHSYFISNEFGVNKGVTWIGGGHKHLIPVRERSPSLKSQGLFDRSGTQKGATGWFFMPTAEHYAPQIRTDIVRDAEAIVRRELAGKMGT